ncbi:uncharacterized protein LOC134831115 [Culicoides brevitarsis]|uniref:uncharacterized protein LOC134831115 n=1 Tax=Culicoides brevitarsis TaxID=469753 RepID=UPI00307C88A8
MSLKLLHIETPELPLSIPLPDGFGSLDKLKISAKIAADTEFEIILKASSEEKIDSRIPLCLCVTNKGIECKTGKNKKWETTSTFEKSFDDGDFLLSITPAKDEYEIQLNDVHFCNFPHKYPAFTSEFLEIKATRGTCDVNFVTYLREMKWIGSRVGLETPENALKCGKDAENNDIYLGRGLKNNKLMITSVNPALKKATVATDGFEYPMHDYELLQDNSYYTWKVICDEKIIPENAVEGGFNEKGEKTFVGRIKIEESVLPGNLEKQTGILSVPYGGKENKYSADYEILTTLEPNEVQKKTNPLKIHSENDKKATFSDEKEKECIICLSADITTALISCGHLKYCQKCADDILANDKRCPLCRQTVTSSIKIFF